jgi:hypothetical protein
MKSTQVIIIVLLVLILAGVVVILLNPNKTSGNNCVANQNLVSKIQESNLSNDQKQEIIKILQKSDDSIRDKGTCTSNSQCRPAEICFVSCSQNEPVIGTSGNPGKCTGMDSVPCPAPYPSESQAKCTADSDCRSGETCFECHGLTANASQVLQKYCLTESQLAQRKAQCAAM